MARPPALDVAAAHLRLAGDTPVSVGLLRDDAPPAVRAAAVADIRSTVRRYAEAAQDSVVVLPVLISSGSIDRVSIPVDLADFPITYTAFPLAPLSHLARWIKRMGLASRPH